MQKEEWRDIGIIDGIDFTGRYQISSMGLVKSLYDGRHKKFRELVLRPAIVTKGYLQVNLWKDGKGKPLRINRLVAIAFDLPIPDHLKHLPLERLQVNHKDEDKTNNCVWNLEWCDANYNNNYGTRNKRSAESRINGKKSKRVLQLDKDTGEVIKQWPSVSEVQRQLGYKQSGISKCCLGKYNQAYGFKWSYA